MLPQKLTNVNKKKTSKQHVIITYRNVIFQLNLPAQQVIEQNDLLDKVYGILSKGSIGIFPFIVFIIDTKKPLTHKVTMHSL